MVSVFVIALALGACDSSIRLQKLRNLSVTPTSAKNPVSVKIEPFFDRRKEKQRIGTFRNVFGGEPRDVVSPNKVAEWVTDGIAEVFRAGGFITDVVTLGNRFDNQDLFIRGDVLQVFAEILPGAFTAHVATEVTIDVQLIYRGKQYSRIFRGESTSSEAFLSVSDLEKFMKQALSELVGDLYREVQLLIREN